SPSYQSPPSIFYEFPSSQPVVVPRCASANPDSARSSSHHASGGSSISNSFIGGTTFGEASPTCHSHQACFGPPPGDIRFMHSPPGQSHQLGNYRLQQPAAGGHETCNLSAPTSPRSGYRSSFGLGQPTAPVPRMANFHTSAAGGPHLASVSSSRTRDQTVVKEEQLPRRKLVQGWHSTDYRFPPFSANHSSSSAAAITTATTNTTSFQSSSVEATATASSSIASPAVSNFVVIEESMKACPIDGDQEVRTGIFPIHTAGETICISQLVRLRIYLMFYFSPYFETQCAFLLDSLCVIISNNPNKGIR
ncbi:unnamed protein product, partial [Protopolystoma xenopodis]